MSFRVAGAGDCVPCQKWAKTWGFVAVSTTTTTTLHSTTLHSLHYTHYITTTTTTTLHHTTLRYTNYITPHYTTRITLHYISLHSTPLHCINQLRHNYDCNELHLQLHYKHYTSLHYTNYTTLHYTTLPRTTLHYPILHHTTRCTTTLLYTTSHSTSLHYTTLHYTTLHSLHHHKCNCNCTTLITTTDTTATTTAALRHTTSSSCAWGDRPGDHCNHCSHFKKHNSNHLSVHQWIRSAIRDSQHPTSPIGFLFLKLPPPPCAVLLVKLSQDRFSGHSSLHLKTWAVVYVNPHTCKIWLRWFWPWIHNNGQFDEQRQSTCINVAKPEATSKRCSWSFVNNTPNGETRYGLWSHYSGFKYTEIWMTRTHKIGDDLQVQPSKQWLFAVSFAQIEQCEYLSVVPRCMYINMWV